MRLEFQTIHPNDIRVTRLETGYWHVAFPGGFAQFPLGAEPTESDVFHPGGTVQHCLDNLPKLPGMLPGLDQVIVGGESGPGARPCDVSWIRGIVQQCKAAGVACFVKQLGSRPIVRDQDYEPNGPDTEAAVEAFNSMRFRHRKCGDPAEWPEDLRVREYPA